MSIVRQSITALYQEAERNAADGSPMLAVIHGTPSQASAMPAGQTSSQATAISALATAPSVKEPAAIVARFDELRRLAEEEALQSSHHLAPAEASDAELVAAIQTNGSDEVSDLVTAEGAQDHPVSERPLETAEAVDIGLSLPDLSASLPSSLPSSLPAFGDVAPVMDSPTSDDTSGEVAADNSIGEQGDPVPDIGATDPLALPAEPPAPEAGAADDLDIADIHSLVQQAWEDETAIAGAAPSSSVEKTQSPAEDPSSQAIATAMDEIAAAVEQSNEPAVPELSDEVKAQLTATIRSELQADLSASLREELRTEIKDEIKTGLKQEVETSLKGFLITDLPAMVKAAVAEAVAEALPTAVDDQPLTAQKQASKTAAPKAAAKKRATAKKWLHHARPRKNRRLTWARWFHLRAIYPIHPPKFILPKFILPEFIQR